MRADGRNTSSVIPSVPVGTAAPEPQPPIVTVTHGKRGPNFLIRAIWYLLVGWWLTGIVSALAWLLCLTIIGLPVAFWIFNRIPTVLTLRPRRETTTTVVSADGSRVDILHSAARQPAFWKRAIYFICIGWWLSGIWIVLAWVLSLLIVTLPIALMMYNRLPAITTLHHY